MDSIVIHCIILSESNVSPVTHIWTDVVYTKLLGLFCMWLNVLLHGSFCYLVDYEHIIKAEV